MYARTRAERLEAMRIQDVVNMTQNQDQEIAGLMTAVASVEPIPPQLEESVNAAPALEGQVLEPKTEITRRNQEIAGLMTAASAVESILPRLEYRVNAAEQLEGKVLELKTEISRRKAEDKLFAAMLAASPETEAKMVDAIAGESRKNIKGEIDSLTVQLSAMNERVKAISLKYGLQTVTVKKAGRTSTAPGTLNIQNATLAKDELEAHGFSNVEIVPLPEFQGYHELRAVGPDGVFHKTRYAINVKDWY